MANRRILRANESEESVRQRAFQQGLKNFADYGAKAMATQRQKALDEATAKREEARAKRAEAQAKRAELQAERDEMRFGFQIDKWEAEQERRPIEDARKDKKFAWEKEKYQSGAQERKVKLDFEKKKFGFLEKKYGTDMARRIVEDEQKDRAFFQKEREWEARERRLRGEDKRKDTRFGWEGEDRGYTKQRRVVDDTYTDTKRMREGEEYGYKTGRREITDRQKDQRFGEATLDRTREQGYQDVTRARESIVFDNELQDRLKKAGFELVDRAEKQRVTARSEELQDEKIDRDIFNTQFDQGLRKEQSNRQFSRDANLERRAQAGEQRKTEEFRRKSFENARVDEAYQIDREDTLDKRSYQLEKEAFNKAQRNLPYEQTREAEKMRFTEALKAKYAKTKLSKAKQNKRVADNLKRYDEASIVGYDIANPDKIPSKEDRKKLTTMHIATKNIVDTSEKLKGLIDDYGITSGAGLTEGDRKVSQVKRALQLQMKELFNLGVLNGPDLDLLDDALGRLQGPIDMINPMNTKETAKAQIENVLNDAIMRLDNETESRGYIKSKSNPVPERREAPSGNESEAEERARLIREIQG